MTSRERQLAAIRHQVPDRIPLDAIAVENQEAIAEFLGIETGEVLARLGIDGRIVAAAHTGSLKPAQDGVSFTEWGTPSTGDYGTARDGYPLAEADSVAAVERHAWPDAAQWDYATAGQTARALGMQYAVRGPYWKPLFCRVCDLFGMERAMMTMIAEPKLFEAALERVSAYTRELASDCSMPVATRCQSSAWATISPRNAG